MAAKFIPAGTFCVFSNGIWKPLKDTVGYGDHFKRAEFRKLLSAAKVSGQPFKYKGVSFKVQQEHREARV